MAAFSMWSFADLAHRTASRRQHPASQPRRKWERRWPVRILTLGIALACAVSAAASVAYYVVSVEPHPSTGLSASPNARERRLKYNATVQRQKSHIRLADATDAWLQSLRDPDFWQRDRNETGRARRETRPKERRHRRRDNHETRGMRTEPARHQSVRPDDGATYRTMCVRLCDGYFWPVSFTATKREFVRDSEICKRSCDSPVALHVYRNPGEEPENMVDLNGQPYTGLGAALRYRASYDATCKCHPHPWESASRRRHQSYAHSDKPRAAMAP